MSKNEICIVAAKRTPMGAFQGSLSSVTTVDLGAHAIRSVLEDIPSPHPTIKEVIMGCVLPAGLGQAPARQAAITAKLSSSVGATTINKVCGSGMKAIMLAHDQIKSDEEATIIAGGMESMSNAPYLLLNARKGYRAGHGKIFDHMMYDGLEDAYKKGCSMGVLGEIAVEQCQLTRQQQDEFAALSAKRALQAINEGWFQPEISPLSINVGKEVKVISEDEPPTRVKFDKIPLLKPAFKEGGTITAANSSPLTDGAAAVVLMTTLKAKEHNLSPRALIRGHVTYSHEPDLFTLAPINAIKLLLNKVNWKIEDVDLFEINEAFAFVPMAVIQELKLDINKVNIHGGACALGHPIGASGTRIIVTLLHALERYNLKRGIAALCIGGGEATAIAIERQEQ
ncbi:MAG: thiolase family protein [Candidatus Paracaedimonas acanthamoebae]|uniref:Thiolase family protein n=1 Tax=Candidatus Paracaedimonas acanthamoebae TaxID=244581 RepID=A0A8J7PZR7_9PROT|nr:thiolase family protein [Candidatus Paracaedimonas acanthamoebae]